MAKQITWPHKPHKGQLVRLSYFERWRISLQAQYLSLCSKIDLRTMGLKQDDPRLVTLKLDPSVQKLVAIILASLVDPEFQKFFPQALYGFASKNYTEDRLTPHHLESTVTLMKELNVNLAGQRAPISKFLAPRAPLPVAALILINCFSVYELCLNFSKATKNLTPSELEKKLVLSHSRLIAVLENLSTKGKSHLINFEKVLGLPISRRDLEMANFQLIASQEFLLGHVISFGKLVASNKSDKRTSLRNNFIKAMADLMDVGFEIHHSRKSLKFEQKFNSIKGYAMIAAIVNTPSMRRMLKVDDVISVEQVSVIISNFEVTRLK